MMNFKELVKEEFKGPQTNFCLTEKFHEFRKSNERAKEGRSIGNEIFMETYHNGRTHQRIWDLYLHSIALSEKDSEELALSYNNMTTLTYHLGKYVDCIKDIDRALKITKLDSRRIKLLCRKAKCMKALNLPEMDGPIEEAIFWLKKIENDDPDKKSLTDLIKKARKFLKKPKKEGNESDANPLKTESVENESKQEKNKSKKTTELPKTKCSETIVTEERPKDNLTQTDFSQSETNQLNSEKAIKESSEIHPDPMESESSKAEPVVEEVEAIQSRIEHINIKSGVIDAQVLQEQGKLIGIDISTLNCKQTGDDEFELKINDCLVKYTTAYCVDEIQIKRQPPQSYPSQKKKRKKKTKNKTFKTQDPHLEILAEKEKQNIFDSVIAKYTDKSGRHLVAAKNIQPGEIIFVNKPYAVVPNFLSKYYCNNCLKPLWSCIPCENCPCSLYCSEECQEEAEKTFHKFECEVLPFTLFGNYRLDYPLQVSLRAVLKGVKEFGTISSLREEMEFIDNSITKDYDSGFSRDGKFRPNSFVSIFGFKNIFVASEDLNQLAKYCCRAVIGLTKYTIFFGKNKKFEKVEDFIENENIIFIAALLLRVAVIVYNNGMKVIPIGTPCTNDEKEVEEQQNPCASVDPCCERGYSLNTISHLIPHSCDPNVKSIKTEGNREILYCIQPIYKGDPLIECYRSTFFESELVHRADATAQILNRYCTCQACQESWPAVLISDGNPMSYEELFNIVMESREYDEEKQSFYDLVDTYGLRHQKIIDELSQILEASFDYFGQPSAEVCAAICFLNYSFNALYGLKDEVPEECKSSEK